MSLFSFIGSVLAPGTGLGGSNAAPDTAPYTQNTNLASYGPDPAAGPLSSYVQNMQQFSPVSAPQAATVPGAYQAQDESNVDLPQFDSERNQVNSQYSQNQSEAQDALNRQFAAAGGGPGNGAQAKSTEALAYNTEQQKSQDLQSINSQEAATRTQLQQTQQQEAFQSGEQAQGEQFSANETANQEEMQAGEYNQQMEQAQNQFGFQANSTIAGLNDSWDEAQAQSNNNAFNMTMSQWQATHSGGLLGGGGFLGTGIGAGGF